MPSLTLFSAIGSSSLLGRRFLQVVLEQLVRQMLPRHLASASRHVAIPQGRAESRRTLPKQPLSVCFTLEHQDAANDSHARAGVEAMYSVTGGSAALGRALLIDVEI